MLLSAFAFQAVEAERRARLADQALRLQEKAQGIVRELDDILRNPARRVQAEVGQLEGLTGPLDAVAALDGFVDREPFFDGYFVLDGAGRRVYPAIEREVEPVRWPQDLVAQAGGVAGACLSWGPGPAVEAVDRLPASVRRQALAGLARLTVSDRADALVFHQRLARHAGDRRVRATALYDLGSLHQSGTRLSEVLNALEAFGELSDLPIGLVDERGRFASARARFQMARLYRLLGHRRAYLEGLGDLLDELERSSDRLPADLLVDLAERTGELLDLELEDEAGRAAVTRARALSTHRRQVEARYARLEDLFGRPLQRALEELSRAPASERLPDPVLVKERVGGRPEVLGYAFLPRPSGGRGPLGLVALRYDPEALERACRSRVALAPGTELLLGGPGASPFGEVSANPEVQEVALRAPLEHMGLRVRSAPDDPTVVEDVLDVPRDTIQLWTIALSIGGVAAGVLVTIHTVRREAKAAQLKSDFVSNVTHELKTPLTSIRMFLETLMLGRVEDEEEARECLEVMSRECERLTRLIEQLLVFSRIENRKWRLRLGFEDPRALVDEAIRILADQLGRPPHELGIQVVVVQELQQIAVDRFALVEAVLNLIHNAWKYSAGSERRVRVVITSRRRHVEMAIEDNGIGVPSRDRRRIFVKFERGSNAEQERIEGSGIGLTLAKSIVEAHGGWISYAPNKPRGSRFSVFLPK